MKISMMVLDHCRSCYFFKKYKTLWIEAPRNPKKASNPFEAFEAEFMEL